jgi:hypothetical protein
MRFQEESSISCPYCGEMLDILVDPSVDKQVYTEDCQVCCQPMVIEVQVSPDGLRSLRVHREDEV